MQNPKLHYFKPFEFLTTRDQELEDELRNHLERKTEEYIAQGMRQEEAHRRARQDLGGIEQTKEKCRDARRVNWVQDFAQDLHFGARMLRKSPGFTSTHQFPDVAVMCKELLPLCNFRIPLLKSLLALPHLLGQLFAISQNVRGLFPPGES